MTSGYEHGSARASASIVGLIALFPCVVPAAAPVRRVTIFLSFGVVVIAALSVLTATAVAAGAPGMYKGNLYQANGVKIANAPATVSVTGIKVTINATALPINCLSASGTYTMPSPPMRYVFKGTLKGNEVNGNYIPPLGGAGEYFVAKGRFFPATKSFVGKLSFMGKCRGTSTMRANKV